MQSASRSAGLSYVIGFLETVGMPHLRWFWVWPVMCLGWVLGQYRASARYR